MSSNIKVQRICQCCGNEFTARTTVTNYCGDTCAKRAYKARKRNNNIQKSNTETIHTKTRSIEELKTKDFLTVRDAAQLLGCSVRTMYRLIDNRTINAINLGERLTRIKRSDLNALI